MSCKRALGACYYPEHWPEEDWATDAVRMVDLGLTWVRIGEFCWSRLEPHPEDMQWDWLDRAIEVLGAAHLKVILGTPTATPPRWMLEKWPDMLALDANENERKFGSRRHYCFSHLGYRTEAGRIARLLGERYGRNPHVAAWQIDNEYDCHDTALSYSNSALHGFRNWLEKKYVTVQALNTVWGNVFWSMEYDNFDQIDLPNLTVTEPNPAHVLDFRRYTSDQVVAFNRTQVQALRPLTDAPLIHNYMGRITGFDHFEVGKDLDIASWDNYPLGSLERRSDMGEDWKKQFLRQGDPDFQAFHHDLYRGVGRGRMWVMEQQPGPVNWAAYNPAPLPGMVRLWTWEAFAHGAETVCYFRWRQTPFAQEQMHAGLLRPDSAPAPALAEAEQVAGELSEMPQTEPLQSPVAMIFDYTSEWAWETQPQGTDFDYFRLVFDFYRALRKLGLSIDILPPDTDNLDRYKLVLMPGLMCLGKKLRHAIEQFDGVVLAGPRSGSKTDNFSIPTPLPPNIPGIEATVELVESLRPNTQVSLANGGAFVRWFEQIDSVTPVLERTESGAPALIGNGSIHYLCGWPTQEALMRILQNLCSANDVDTTILPQGVRIRDTSHHRFTFNYSAETQALNGDKLASASVKWRVRPAG